MGSKKTMKMKAVILLSGGIDSATCLALAIKEYGKDNVLTLCCRYGQKHEVELTYAGMIAKHYGVKMVVFDLCSVYSTSTSSLIANSGIEVDKGTYSEVVSQSTSMISSCIPFRNGVMISAANAIALSEYPDSNINIYIGSHQDDNCYPDCSESFIEAMDSAIFHGSGRVARLISPFVSKTKAEIVALGISLGIPHEMTYSCYNGRAEHCGTCPSCRTRQEAFDLNNKIDPVKYEAI